MRSSLASLNQRGITLTEVLIGIMVLGIGVISLATLFPIGLLRMQRAVNDVRGTLLAESAADEVRVRNLVAPPLGPWFFDDGTANGQGPLGSSLPGVYSPFSTDPHGASLLPLATAYGSGLPGGLPPYRPTRGGGIPVVIDPLWMLQSASAASPIASRLGLADVNRDGTVDFFGAQGFIRIGGGINSLVLPSRITDGITSMELASGIVASPDDLVYMDADQAERQRVIPFQTLLPGATVPPYLTPTYGTAFSAASMHRDRRYTWLAIVRKVSAGQIYSPGPNGLFGAIVAELDDRLDDVGPDGIANLPGSGSSILPGGGESLDDPATDMATGAPILAPMGPFSVTIVVFHKRDFTNGEIVFTNDMYPAGAALPVASRPVPIFCPVPRYITIGGTNYGPYSANEATLVQRADGIPFPEIPVGSFVLDSTFDASLLSVGGNMILGPLGGHVYRVTGKSLTLVGGVNILVLTLDQPARSNGPIPAPIPGEPPYTLPLNKLVAGTVSDPGGYVLTYLKGAVGVFERQIP